jgi:uncharacterized coiled-coil protein SlyX
MAKQRVSITELERLLAAKKKRLDALQKKKDRLTSLIAGIDNQIASLIGKTAAPRKGRRRPKKGKSLRQSILDFLGQSPEPKSITEIAEAVTQTGYRSSSKNFVSLVRQVCYKSDAIQKVEKGRFALKGGSSSPRPPRRAKKAASK